MECDWQFKTEEEPWRILSNCLNYLRKERWRLTPQKMPLERLLLLKYITKGRCLQKTGGSMNQKMKKKLKSFESEAHKFKGKESTNQGKRKSPELV